jgi:hypothetical protein
MISFKAMRCVLFILPFSSNLLFAQLSDTTRIVQHMTKITKTEQSRNYKQLNQLNATADYILEVFSQYSDSAYFQEFKVADRIYKNVICTFGPSDAKTIVIGAHYDVCQEQEGADDNASGVVGLLELARLLKNEKLKYKIELVAYTLEEPPFFRTEYMGSFIHAQSLQQAKTDVLGMICLEMIAYFSDKKGSQEYPIGLMSLFYGKKGNYITMIKKTGAGKFARKFSSSYKKKKTIRTKRFTGPKSIQGIDFSDHLNYWKFGYSAVMVTDTAFYRNRNYHQKSDTMETLDFHRMSKVIDGVFTVLISMN